MMFNPDTKDCVARRTTEGKVAREIRRCLKRLISRQLFRKLRAFLTSITKGSFKAPRECASTDPQIRP